MNRQSVDWLRLNDAAVAYCFDAGKQMGWSEAMILRACVVVLATQRDVYKDRLLKEFAESTVPPADLLAAIGGFLQQRHKER